MYSLYVHNKHNQDWSDNSYNKIMTFNNDNIEAFLSNLNYYNTLDYDISISKDGLIPNNENNLGMHKIDFSIRENYENTMKKFEDMLRLMFNGSLDKYEPKFMSIIVKTDVFCIRLVCKKYVNGMFEDILKRISGGENNLKTCREFHNEIGDMPTFRKQKTLTKPIYVKKFTNGNEDTYKKKKK